MNLHRDIASSMAFLGVKNQELKNAELAEDLPLFPEPPGSRAYLGDPTLLGKNLAKYKNLLYKIRILRLFCAKDFISLLPLLLVHLQRRYVIHT